jgi:hypothetical protein
MSKIHPQAFGLIPPVNHYHPSLEPYINWFGRRANLPHNSYLLTSPFEIQLVNTYGIDPNDSILTEISYMIHKPSDIFSNTQLILFALNFVFQRWVSPSV